jgi:hypothetical protein
MENSGWIQFEDQQKLPLGGDGRSLICLQIINSWQLKETQVELNASTRLHKISLEGISDGHLRSSNQRANISPPTFVLTSGCP